MKNKEEKTSTEYSYSGTEPFHLTIAGKDICFAPGEDVEIPEGTNEFVESLVAQGRLTLKTKTENK